MFSLRTDCGREGAHVFILPMTNFRRMCHGTMGDFAACSSARVPWRCVSVRGGVRAVVGCGLHQRKTDCVKGRRAKGVHPLHPPLRRAPIALVCRCLGPGMRDGHQSTTTHGSWGSRGSSQRSSSPSLVVALTQALSGSGIRHNNLCIPWPCGRGWGGGVSRSS